MQPSAQIVSLFEKLTGQPVPFIEKRDSLFSHDPFERVQIRGRVLQSNIAKPRPRATAASGQKSSGGQRWDGRGSAGLTSSLQAWM
jgi:hypothetical protein